jgi:hypothetical protein
MHSFIEEDQVTSLQKQLNEKSKALEFKDKEIGHLKAQIDLL